MAIASSLAALAAGPQTVFTELATLPTGAWDVLSFLKNAFKYGEGIGGGVLTLLGLIAVVVGGVKLLFKLMAGQQNQTSWISIVLMIIIGGALMVGGITLMKTVASGGKTTILDLGGGAILMPGLF